MLRASQITQNPPSLSARDSLHIAVMERRGVRSILSFDADFDRWPGLQAPQHTVLFDRQSLLAMARKAGLEVEVYLPYGAFPAYFYLFAGAAFKLLKGRGLNLDRAILPGVGSVLHTLIDKDAVGAVNRRRTERLAVERHDAAAEFSGRFGKQLLEPGAERGDRGRSNDRQLVAAMLRRGAEDRAEDDPRVLNGRRARGARAHHLGRSFEQGARVDAGAAS